MATDPDRAALTPIKQNRAYDENMSQQDGGNYEDLRQ
jgi:hypothetical protein